MNSYEFFHLSMRCIGITFFLVVLVLVILMAVSSNADPDGDGR